MLWSPVCFILFKLSSNGVLQLRAGGFGFCRSESDNLKGRVYSTRILTSVHIKLSMFAFYAVPEGELGASDVPAGEAAGEAPVQYNDESASDQNENFETVQ
ncbi:hypothetical protein D5086_016796 [Populus alba]|uniref:Uncharacterized protein n=1 Tax=Populus alba TaxID=43335 RepID=A0ACC4BUZ1_POPAL